MKFLNYFFFLPASLVLFALACNKSSSSSTTEQNGNWVSRSEFDGNARAYPVSFVIGDTAYVGTGYDGNSTRLTDFWTYDDARKWKQISNFPGKARNSASAFTVGGKGYVLLGTDGATKFSDNYEYNPATGLWKRMADFIATDTVGGTPVTYGSARYGASGFAIGNKGYIACGYDGGYKKDCLEFDPNASDTGKWTAKTSFGGMKRYNANIFIYNNQAYLMAGISTTGNANDFWKFDPTANSWTELRKLTNVSTDSYDDDYTDIIRNGAASFVMGNKGYLTLGIGTGYTKKTWEYDFATDTWARKTPFERLEREGSVGFTIKGRGFVTCGKSSSSYFDDLEEFFPNVTVDTND